MGISRRAFIAGGTAVVVAGSAQAAPGFVDYSPGLIKSLLAEGRTLFVDYAASWCSTCARQERVIQKQLKKNPAYLQNVTFVRVDWDKYGKADVTTSRNIPRRSTLLVLKGNQELGRVVAGTRVSEIKTLMNTALAAASSS